MASAIASLEVAFTADKKGLESALKSASNTMAQFVDRANSNKIDWTKIMTATLSPGTIIAEIGALFSLAVASAAGFQEAMANTGAQSTDAFRGANSAISDAAVGISDATGQSAGDVAQALGIAAKGFSDLSIQSEIVNEASMMASRGIGTVTQNTEMLVDALRAWGITTAPAAQQAMDKLAVAAINSGIDFATFARTITDQAPNLKASMDFNTAVSSLYAMSTQAGITGTQAVAMFTNIGNAIGAPLSQAGLLLKNIGGIEGAIKAEGVVGAFDKITQYLSSKSTPAAHALGEAMGFTAMQVDILKNTTLADLAQMDQKFVDMKNNQETFSQVFKDTDNAISEMHRAWANFVNALATSGPAKAGVDQLTNSLREMTDIIHNSREGWDELKATFESMKLLALQVPTDLKNAVDAQNQQADTTSKYLNLTNAQSALYQGSTSAYGYGKGFNADEAKKITSMAKSDQDLQNLYNALTGKFTQVSNTTSFFSTFNIAPTSGSNEQIANTIVAELYNKYHGTK